MKTIVLCMAVVSCFVSNALAREPNTAHTVLGAGTTAWREGRLQRRVSATAVLLPPARSPAHAPVAFAFLGMQPHVEVAVPSGVFGLHQPR